MKNKKKLWLSITVVAAVIALGAAGTYAYFTAIRTASTNKFTMGTLDLNVKDEANKVNEPFVIDTIGATGKISGSKTWTVTNTGSLPGYLLVNIKNLKNEENDCNDQELATEPNCKADNAGEMGGVVTLNVGLTPVGGGTSTDLVSSTLATANQNKIGDDWNKLDKATLLIPAGQTRQVTLHWDTPETAYGNEIQSDSVSFDTNFRLIQVIEGATPSN